MIPVTWIEPNPFNIYLYAQQHTKIKLLFNVTASILLYRREFMLNRFFQLSIYNYCFSLVIAYSVTKKWNLQLLLPDIDLEQNLKISK